MIGVAADGTEEVLNRVSRMELLSFMFFALQNAKDIFSDTRGVDVQ